MTSKNEYSIILWKETILQYLIKIKIGQIIFSKCKLIRYMKKERISKNWIYDIYLLIYKRILRISCNKNKKGILASLLLIWIITFFFKNSKYTI
jgi:hypothetical protein